MERYEGSNGIECIKAIEAALTYEEFRGFCKGNIIKYVWRESQKGGVVDISKMQDYADYLIEADLARIGEELGPDALLASECRDALRKIMDRGTDA